MEEIIIGGSKHEGRFNYYAKEAAFRFKDHSRVASTRFTMRFAPRGQLTRTVLGQKKGREGNLSFSLSLSLDEGVGPVHV